MLPLPTTLNSAGLEVNQSGEHSCQEHSKHSIEPKDQTSLWPLWASDALKPKGKKKEKQCQEGATDPDYKGKTGLLLHNEIRSGQQEIL